jgi:hypothetical protein
MQWREPLLGVAWKRGEIRENQTLLGQAYNIGGDLAART